MPAIACQIAPQLRKLYAGIAVLFSLVLVALPASAAGSAFADVPGGHWAVAWINQLGAEGITSGCASNPPRYCPANTVSRAEMAVFLVRALHGSGYQPAASDTVFADVASDHWAKAWVAQLYNEGITTGCGQDPLRYCPDQQVSRAEMAVFLERALRGASYVPPAGDNVFADVADNSWARDWVNRLRLDGITSGCGTNPLRYCPAALVTRAEMAVFLLRVMHGAAYQPPDPSPAAGNPSGNFTVPVEARADDVSSPDHVVGSGTAASCTADAFIQAVALGGKIIFNCGAAPVTITLSRPAKVFNDKPDIVIDGGGLVTLSGGGTTRILYMNTCDPNQVWTTSHCQDQAQPRLTVQNLTFVNGNSKNETTYDGGGAIWVRGGRFKVVNSRFFNNVCASEGPDVGGAAIRVFSQYQGLPVYVTHSTFGGAPGYGNTGSNGGAISSIGVSWSIYNSLFSYNKAIGSGGNPAQAGKPGGGSGGAIYNDGNTMTLAIYGTLIEHNEVNAYGSSIFFVTNDHSGNLHIQDSVSRNNLGGSWYNVLPGISMHDDTVHLVINSTIQ